MLLLSSVLCLSSRSIDAASHLQDSLLSTKDLLTSLKTLTAPDKVGELCKLLEVFSRLLKYTLDFGTVLN